MSDRDTNHAQSLNESVTTLLLIDTIDPPPLDIEYILALDYEWLRCDAVNKMKDYPIESFGFRSRVPGIIKEILCSEDIKALPEEYVLALQQWLHIIDNEDFDYISSANAYQKYRSYFNIYRESVQLYTTIENLKMNLADEDYQSWVKNQYESKKSEYIKSQESGLDNHQIALSKRLMIILSEALASIPNNNGSHIPVTNFGYKKAGEEYRINTLFVNLKKQSFIHDDQIQSEFYDILNKDWSETNDVILWETSIADFAFFINLLSKYFSSIGDINIKRSEKFQNKKGKLINSGDLHTARSRAKTNNSFNNPILRSIVNDSFES